MTKNKVKEIVYDAVHHKAATYLKDVDELWECTEYIAEYCLDNILSNINIAYVNTMSVSYAHDKCIVDLDEGTYMFDYMFDGVLKDKRW